MSTKDEFIVYLQDEIAFLRAKLEVKTEERVRNEVDFKQTRGYKSVHSRVREQVLANKRLHTPVEIEDISEKVDA